MLSLNCKIVIYEINENDAEKAIEINFVNQIDIESTWREFTDTATITLPRFIDPEITGLEKKDKNFWEHLQLWARHHPHIEIFLGYNGREHLAFKGIIRDVKASVPVTLVCEDDMYHLKTKMITYSAKEATLKSIVQSFTPVYNAIGQEIEVDFDEQEVLGAFITDKPMTPVKILEKLKDDFGIYSFIRCFKEIKGDKVTYKSRLVIGKEYQINHGNNANTFNNNDDTLNLGGNFIFHENIIEDELEYKFKEDIQVKVTFIAKGVDENDEVKVTYPDDKQDGQDIDYVLMKHSEYREEFFNNVIFNKQGNRDLTKEAEELTFYIFEHDLKEKRKDKNKLIVLRKKLLKMAKRRLELIKHDGFTGSFTTFGDALFDEKDIKKNIGGFVRHGNYIKLHEQDRVFKVGKIEDHQDYYVDGVSYSFGESGFRQTIQLGQERKLKKVD